MAFPTGAPRASLWLPASSELDGYICARCFRSAVAATEDPIELAVVRDVVERLSGAGIPYMLTGSLAMNYYAEPRMTRDVDVVIEVRSDDAPAVAALFADAYYADSDAIAQAIATRTSFNIIHRAALVKVDCFPRRSGAFREAEFSRRQRIRIGDTETFIVTREDLIIAKLLWARDSESELQLRDVRNLAAGAHDAAYVRRWVERLGVAELLNRAVS